MFVVPRITGEVDNEEDKEDEEDVDDDKEGEGDAEEEVLLWSCSCFAVGLLLFLLLCTLVEGGVEGDGVRLQERLSRKGYEVEKEDDERPSHLDRPLLVLLGVLSTCAWG